MKDHASGNLGAGAMPESIQEIRRFDALTDDSASSVTIIEYRTVDLRRTVNGELQSIDGPVRWVLPDGSQVNRVEDKTYKVFLTGQMLRHVG
jgi:hypothetical protein